MPIDALIANPGRLRILTALVSEPRQEFVRLRGATQLTDGNLTTHARRLHSAGMLEIDKSIRDGKPVTTYILTKQGRQAFQKHVEVLVESLRPESGPAQPEIEPTVDSSVMPEYQKDNWVD